MNGFANQKQAGRPSSIEKTLNLGDVGRADFRNSKGLFKSRSKDCSKNTCAITTYRNVLVGAADKKGTIVHLSRIGSAANAVDPKI